jgi:adenylosuccinate synthase
VEDKNVFLERVYGLEPLDPDAIAQEFAGYAERLRGFVADDSLAINRAIERGERVLLEGAQGPLLDIDHGTYPYVTSSSTVTGGALAVLGIGARQVSRVLGVAKAYQTRVGEGPFPTEQLGEAGNRLRGTGQNLWDEFGTTTGRPRRCGWLDLVAVSYSARVCGLTELVLTKFDILSGFETIKVCTAYSLDGQLVDSFVPQAESLAKVTPVYTEMPGWAEPLGEARRFEDLPVRAQDYVRLIEQRTGLPVSVISVGPEREQTIIR